MNVYHHVYIALVIGAMVGAFGCKSVEQVQTQSKAKSNAPLFNVTAPPLQVLTNETATAQLALKPVPPWKINTEYPTKLQLEASGTAAHFSPQKVSFGGSDIAVAESKATLSIPLRGDRPGESTMNGTLKFSLCRADQCILRESPVAWNIRVAEPTR